MNNISIIILAAGLGTRMKSTTPKVMFKLSGVSMIRHVLKQAYEITNDVHVVLYHQKELIQEHILSEFKDTQIHIQDLANFPGTAGALKGIKFKGEKVLITCGDMPLVSAQELKSLCDKDADITMSSFVCKDPFGYGRVIEKDSKVTGIVEQKDASEEERKINRVNAGCYCFKREVLEEILPLINNQNSQKEYYLTDAIKIANQKNLSCVAVDVCEQNFMGINDKFQLSIAENIMQDNIKKEWMKFGINMRLPQTIFIDARAVFKGECVVEENVSILGECLIEESIIKSSSVIEESIIKSSDIGPLAHIRPKSKISGTHIGNFVEVKKGVLNGVKAGHLSYLGDCEIDSGTNIGCGTITCNYDGKAKHKTVIGKNVFIGSDSQLVAPVNIGDDVLIAAGSTVTSDVPSGALAISRGKQINKEGFFYKFFGKKDA
ncbi:MULTISPECIES: bifunctional UDP-N-acetylglucosamine diphosphorylase/glucosamine-1-phosphate N-acetyltransferase GlmU [Campylobacter]|uniref:bifunctional UDP-N-acetylglucosamine diphosphorylase/glucosamine-1-phosphate N-acetyltransferase GlmU n=1 Tax=Campylobacter TaxID=194 RepID=UPI001473BACE|nr:MULTISPECIES: bifunctional UDP-N-acetylglucosamine diphosphorylase/glucosamine-1-phosphate N-acetyltransferase GlmU [unclassified Campylobacter]MBE3610559.1 bifunctional UDP-N-acetylglucosamine diphosphorylase/glucosamine-1-phosphate N-acetyltransferase GlmU [Campylobacter sp. RM12916]